MCVCARVFGQSGNAKTVTVDGSNSQTVLPNLIPGVTYAVTVIALKSQRESEPASDSVTTGKICATLTKETQSLRHFETSVGRPTKSNEMQDPKIVIKFIIFV